MRTVVATLLALTMLGALVPAARADDEPTEPERCCKVCVKGRACGDSCISRAKQCTKPRGCACDAPD